MDQNVQRLVILYLKALLLELYTMIQYIVYIYEPPCFDSILPSRSPGKLDLQVRRLLLAFFLW